jgi:hypothetical protein
LLLNIEPERAVATEQKNENWRAIFKGTDGVRTLTALWTIVAQQFLGLALFGTFGTYFFQQAGIAEPFRSRQSPQVLVQSPSSLPYSLSTGLGGVGWLAP